MKQQSRLLMCVVHEAHQLCAQAPPDFVSRRRWLNKRLFTWVMQSGQHRGQPYCTAFVKNLMLCGANTIGQWTSHSTDQTGSDKTWWSQSYLIIIPPLLWLNDKCPHIRNGHLDCALARGLILCDQVRRGGYGSVHLDLRLRGGGRGKRLERKWDRWNRNDGGLMETEGTLYMKGKGETGRGKKF